MLQEFWLILASTIVIIHHCRATSDDANPSSSYFSWLNADGSLVRPNITDDLIDDDCCGLNCNEGWSFLEDLPNCKFCSSNYGLICEGSDIYDVPTPEHLPTTNLSLFKMTGVGLIALPPHSFDGLTIDKLVIEDSNLTYLASDTFAGVESIKAIHLRNNALNYLHHADFLFESIRDLSMLSLENNSIRVMSSSNSAYLSGLQYFSLAGNPIYTLNLLFLKDSDLRFLDLRGIQFRVKYKDIEGCGFSSLPDTLNALDLSYADISTAAIHKLMLLLSKKNLTTLNLSFMKISSKVFNTLQPVRKTLKYLSVEGTDVNDLFPADEKGTNNLTFAQYNSLKEINMANCNIQYLGAGEIFRAIPNLTTLSLSRNYFTTIDLTLLSNLPQLNYLDLSSNTITDVQNYNNSTSSNIIYVNFILVIFDLNYESSIQLFSALSNVEILSLSRAKINSYQVRAIQNLYKLKHLDLSGTFSYIIPDYKALHLNLNLRALNLTSDELETPVNTFSMASLKTLDLSNNLIRDFSQFSLGPALENLVISQNLISTWYYSVISNQSNLKSIDLSNNEITYISDAMIQDFHKLKSLNLDNNPLICNDKVVDMVCSNVENNTHNITIVDSQHYKCYDVSTNNYRLFSKPEDCDEYIAGEVTTRIYPNVTQRTIAPTSISNNVTGGKRLWAFAWSYIIIGFLAITLFSCIAYFKGVDIRFYIYQYCRLRKALIYRKNYESMVDPDIRYDVFVSYSDVDRYWVIDHLVPNMENDGDIRLCFHERDFQIGLSILENIIQCMDSSQSLLLIVSSAFVRSKWCQFEMHLAQYRLIETLKDHLVLVLLEDIPRKIRPMTLHHLMMTKTYLVWPNDADKDNARNIFWKRLKHALRPNHKYVRDSQNYE